MAQYRANTSSILSPEDVVALLVRPAIDGSIVGKIATLVTTASPSVRFPVVQTDPTAAWTLEGQEIGPSDMAITEVVASPSKLAGLVVASSELLADSIDGSASAILGAGLARDLSRRMDEAFFAGMAAPAPAGLAQLVGYSAVAAPPAWRELDPFSEAAGAVEAESAALTAWVLAPGDVVALSLVKEASASNRALLTPDRRAPPAGRFWDCRSTRRPRSRSAPPMASTARGSCSS